MRADLTGHSHHTCFGRKGLDGHALLGQPPVQDFNSFCTTFYYIISTTYQKIGDLFCTVHISGPLITDGWNSSKWTRHYIGWSKTLQMVKMSEQIFEKYF